MSAKINITKLDNYAIIKLEGRLLPTGDESIDEKFRESFDNLINEGIKKIILDFRDVDFIASSSIGVILYGYNKLSDVNGKLVIWRPKNYIAQSLKLVKIDKIVSIFENENDALKELGINLFS